jgi:glycosyltransferase involved in cell wall biosynthesis
MPSVTFLVPCYNYARYLRECVASIQLQTLTDWELLILDDASTDETPELADSLAADDPRIRYYRHPENIGHLANYNDGIERAQGELIWLISADDCLASPTVAEEFLGQFQSNPKLGFAFCRVQCIDEHSTPYDKFIPRANYEHLPEQATLFEGHSFFGRLVKENFVPAPGAIARKRCYEQYGKFHMALTHSGDWYNWLLFALNWDVYYQPEAKVYYRKHQQNMHMTYAKPRQALENTLLCYTELQRYLKQGHYPAALQRKTELAKLQFMNKNGFRLSAPEKLSRMVGKLTGQYP